MGKTSYKLEHYTIKKYYGVLLWSTFMHYTCNGDFINTVYRIVFAHEWLNIVFISERVLLNGKLVHVARAVRRVTNES